MRYNKKFEQLSLWWPLLRAICVLGVLTATLETAHGTLVGVQQHSPDISSFFIDVSYDNNTNSFIADGFATNYDIDGIAPPDYGILNNGHLNISLKVNSLGVVSPGGTLKITGKIPGLGATSNLLLTGSISQFGFLDPPGGMDFDFLFNVTGGDLAGAMGPTVGLILSDLTGFDGLFDHPFNNLADGNAVADAFSTVPEPASIVLCGEIMSAIAQIAFRRRRLRAI